MQLTDTEKEMLDGKAGEAVLQDLNVTLEHHVAERTAALYESEARFRHLIEGSLQGILIHRGNQALFVNSAYAELLGYDNPDDWGLGGVGFVESAPRIRRCLRQSQPHRSEPHAPPGPWPAANSIHIRIGTSFDLSSHLSLAAPASRLSKISRAAK